MLIDNVTINSETIANNKVYFLHKYFPVRHFSWNSLDQDSANFRSNLFKFKDGASQSVTKMFANEIISALQKIAPNFNRSQYAFLAVPASTENKTVARYSLLLEILKQNFSNVSFVNDYITFTGERAAKHLSNTAISDTTSHFTINGGVSGKNVIIFDDVITTGQSIMQMGSKIMDMGASSYLFISLGRTVDYRTYNLN